MMSDRSSKPPMTLPIRIQSEMGMARPFRTSRTVWAGRKTAQYKNESRSSPAWLWPSYLPPDCFFPQSDEVCLLSCQPIGSYYLY